MCLLPQIRQAVTSDTLFICLLREHTAESAGMKKALSRFRGRGSIERSLHGDTRNRFAPVGLASLRHGASLKNIGRAGNQTGDEQRRPSRCNRLAYPWAGHTVNERRILYEVAGCARE